MHAQQSDSPSHDTNLAQARSITRVGTCTCAILVAPSAVGNASKSGFTGRWKLHGKRNEWQADVECQMLAIHNMKHMLPVTCIPAWSAAVQSGNANYKSTLALWKHSTATVPHCSNCLGAYLAEVGGLVAAVGAGASAVLPWASANSRPNEASRAGWWELHVEAARLRFSKFRCTPTLAK